MASTFRAVVVSDLHATSRPPGDAAGSWLTTTTPRTVTDHPLIGLQTYLEGLPDKPALILCAGDICDKADEQALTTTWADLVAMADSVGAVLVATAGNHDVDSRHQHELDPRGVLYDLDPCFPARDAQGRDEYWSKNFTVIDGPSTGDTAAPLAWRVVTLNSSAFHGYSAADGPELEHGRVSPRTVRRLRDDLRGRPDALVNILLMHHHLEQLPTVELDDKSQLLGAEELGQLLEVEGPWLVVHGHKHRARILFAHGEGASATIFAAGSMSAYPYGQVAASGITNQAYILDFASEETLEELQLGVAATFTSLSWVPARGWKIANSDFGLPGKGGFGWRAEPRRLARAFEKELTLRGQTQMSAAAMLEIEPKIAYLSPTGLDALKDALGRLTRPIELHRTEHGAIERITIPLSVNDVEEEEQAS